MRDSIVTQPGGGVVGQRSPEPLALGCRIDGEHADLADATVGVRGRSDDEAGDPPAACRWSSTATCPFRAERVTGIAGRDGALTVARCAARSCDHA
jgi:hypothetical protein